MYPKLIIVVVFRQLYREIMRKLNLLHIPILLFVSTASLNATPPVYPTNTPATKPMWPSHAMMPYQYQWPTQQQMQAVNPRQTVPIFPTNTNIQRNNPNYTYPMYRQMPPYNTMMYPPVLRLPAGQTFPQARPMYNYMTPRSTPMPNPYQAQAIYPMQYPRAKVAPQMQQARPMQRPPYRQPIQQKKPKKPWGDVRYIWPDFYTDATGDMWDNMMNAPYDMGRMPGGWRFPSLSSPDPVTVGDAITNQFPPIIDEMPNFVPFMN
jgi:hypothetical protein